MYSRIVRRRGMTLIESMVVCAFMTIVLAVIAPAIQEAREKARSVKCRENLKILGLALHNYHDVFGGFPPGYIAATRVSEKDESRQLDWNSGWGWQAFVLPFNDQAPLYNSISASNAFSLGLPTDDSQITTVKIPNWVCLDDKGGGIVARVKVLGPLRKDRVTTVVEGGFARSNYVGVAGWDNDWHLGMTAKGNRNAAKDETASNWSTQELGHDFRDGIAVYAGPLEMKGKESCPNARDGHGMFGENSFRKQEQVTDGTSNSLLIGERATPTKSGSESDVGNAIWAGVPDRSTRAGQACALGSAFWPVNHEMTADNIPNTTGFNSRHGGAANFINVDGSVHHVSDKIDLALLRRLAIIDDGTKAAYAIPVGP